MKNKFLNRYLFNVFNLSEEMLEAYVKIFKHKKFGYLYGYSNVIIEFSKYLLEKDLPTFFKSTFMLRRTFILQRI